MSGPTNTPPLPGFGTTLITGVQPIAALLPLLGTEQCENHVGSALSDGYLYAAITPVSIFGSLGIASAGFKALFASISIPRRKFLGAEKLRDAGFSPSGKNLSLIMMDPENTGRYLAETQLDALLKASQLEAMHVKDLRRLTIATAYLTRWNFTMVILTAISCLVGITPYLYLNVDPAGNRLDKSARWAFPFLRVLGGFFGVTSLQFLVQQRLLILFKKRLRFHALNNESETILNSLRGKFHLKWDLLTSSEICLSQLEQLLWKLEHRDAESAGEKLDWTALTKLNQQFEGAREHFFPKSSDIQWSAVVLQILMTAGILASVIGYVGCFSIVQGTHNFLGPFLWLLLEGILTISRIVGWGYNPDWHRLEHIKLSLALAPHPPLSTCNKSSDEIFGDKLLPLMRAQEFIKHTWLYTGFLKPVDDTDMSIYYTLTRRSVEGQGRSERVLFITFVDKNERASRVYYEDSHKRAHVLAAEPPIVQPTYNILHTRILNPTDRVHLPIAGSILMSHYQSVLKQVQPRTQPSRRVPMDHQEINWTLSVDRIPKTESDKVDETDNLSEGSQGEKGGKADGIWQLLYSVIPRKRQSVDEWDMNSTLNSVKSTPEIRVNEIEDNFSRQDDDDIRQFPHGVLQRKRQRRSTNQQRWLERLMTEVESMTQTEMDAFSNGSPSPYTIQMRRHTLILERFRLETLFFYETWTWECQLWRDHQSWVDAVVTKRGESNPEELRARLNTDWVRYARARLAEDQATTAARLAEAKEAFIATLSGVFDVNARVLKSAWNALQTSVEDEWQKTIEACGKERAFIQTSVEVEWRKTIEACGEERAFTNTTPGLPLQQPTDPPRQVATSSIGSDLTDSLEQAVRAEEELMEELRTPADHKNMILYNFWKKEREQRYRGEWNDVGRWIIERGLVNCDTPLGCTEECPIIATMVVSPVKWTLITQHMIDSEGIPALSRALQRNPYIRIVEFRSFENETSLAKALRGIIPKKASSLTTIAIPEPIGSEGTAALAEIVRDNSSIRSISTTNSSLTSLMDLVDEVARRVPPDSSATSITFQGFGITQFRAGPTRRSKQILFESQDYSLESKVEIRFLGPKDGDLQLAIRHGSSGTRVTLTINNYLNSSFVLQADIEENFITLKSREDIIPGIQNLVTITPDSESGIIYTLHSIDLLDMDGMPYDIFEGHRDRVNREAEQGDGPDQLDVDMEG